MKNKTENIRKVKINKRLLLKIIICVAIYILILMTAPGITAIIKNISFYLYELDTQTITIFIERFLLAMLISFLIIK